MKKNEKTVIVFALTLLIIAVIGTFLQTIYMININQNHINYENAIVKEEHNFTIFETNALLQSSPIVIKHLRMFGIGNNITNNITYQEKEYFYIKNSPSYVLSNGFYVPTYIVVQEKYYRSNSTSIGDYIPSLIGEKVYISFIADSLANLSSSYIVKTENIKDNEVIWNLTYDGNINNTIIPDFSKNPVEIPKTIYWINGIILLNHTAFISPINSAITNFLILKYYNNS